MQSIDETQLRCVVWKDGLILEIYNMAAIPLEDCHGLVHEIRMGANSATQNSRLSKDVGDGLGKRSKRSPSGVLERKNLHV